MKVENQATDGSYSASCGAHSLFGPAADSDARVAVDEVNSELDHSPTSGDRRGAERTRVE